MEYKIDNTINHYNNNAKDYFDYTVNADMSDHYERFLKYLQENSYILDVGCGSGRDSKYFISQGYKVKAIDGSKELCKLASEYLNETVDNIKFNEIKYTNMFDAIWANASLLHVDKYEIDSVIERLKKALKENGIFYATFKYGNSEREKDGRYYNDQNEDTIRELFKDFDIKELWVSDDVIPGKEDRWINIIVKKQ